MPLPTTPQFDLPLRFSGTDFVQVEDSSDRDVANCVEATLRYRPGDLDANPQFGTPDQVFLQGGPDVEQVVEAVERWEPRAEVLVESDPEQLEDLIGRVTVDVRAAIVAEEA